MVIAECRYVARRETLNLANPTLQRSVPHTRRENHETRFHASSRLRSALRVLAPAILLLALVWRRCPPRPRRPSGPRSSASSVQFALFSANATRVEVWIFATPTASTPTATYALTKTDVPNSIWTVTVAGLGAGTLYGYRVWGPNWTYNASWTPGSNLGFVSHVDANGNRFNPNKLLTDPYAKAVTGEPVRVSGHYSTAILGGTNTYAFVDSAGAMPKSIVISDTYSWGTDVKPNIPMKDSISYEVHLRGFTKNDSSVTAAQHGHLRRLRLQGVLLEDPGGDRRRAAADP